MWTVKKRHPIVKIILTLIQSILSVKSRVNSGVCLSGARTQALKNQTGNVTAILVIFCSNMVRGFFFLLDIIPYLIKLLEGDSELPGVLNLHSFPQLSRRICL